VASRTTERPRGRLLRLTRVRACALLLMLADRMVQLEHVEALSYQFEDVPQAPHAEDFAFIARVNEARSS